MTLVFVHGFTQTGRSWRPITDRLHTTDYLTPDVPGHGQAATARATIDEGAGLLAQAVGRGVWIGYSMGGRLCLSVALDHPEVVSGLVLVSTTPGIRDDKERQQRVAEDEARARKLEADGVPAFLAEWLAAPMWHSLAEDQRGIDERLTNTVDGLASSLRLAGTGAQPSRWDDLPRLNPPVLIVTGSRDAKFTAIGDEMAQTIGPNAQRARGDDAGHAAPWEQPDTFVAVLQEWIKQEAALR